MLVLLTNLLAFNSNGNQTLRVCVSFINNDAGSASDLLTYSQHLNGQPSNYSNVNINITSSYGKLSSGTSVSDFMVTLGKNLTDFNCDAIIGPDLGSDTDGDTVYLSHYPRQFNKPVCSVGQLGEDIPTRQLANNLISVVPSTNLLIQKLTEIIGNQQGYQIIVDPDSVVYTTSFANASVTVLDMTKPASSFKNDLQATFSNLAASPLNTVLFLGSPALFNTLYDTVAYKMKNTIQWVLVSMTPILLNPAWKNVYLAYQPETSSDSNQLLCLKSILSFYEYYASTISSIGNGLASLPILNISGIPLTGILNASYSSIGDLESSWVYVSLNGNGINPATLTMQDLRMQRGSTLLQVYPSSYISLLVFAYFFIVLTILIGVVLRRKMQRRRSGILDMTTIVGIILGNMYIFSAIPKPSDSTCPKSVWLLPISLSIILSTMIVRSYRLYRIFGGAKLHSQKLNDLNLFLFVVCMVLVNVIILGFWNIVDPLKPTVNYQYLEMQCYSTYNTYFTAVLIAYNGILLIVAGFLANSTRKIVSEYTESTQLAWCVYNVALWGLISLPIQFTSGIDPMLRTVFSCVIVLLGVNFFTALLFGPILVKTRNELNASRSTTSVSTFQKINAGTSTASHLTTNTDTKLFTHMADICEPGAVNMYKRYLVIVSLEEKYIDLFDMMDSQVNFAGRTFRLDLLDKLKMEDMKNGGLDLVLDQTHLYVLFNGEELNTKFKQLIRPFVQMKQNANLLGKN